MATTEKTKDRVARGEKPPYIDLGEAVQVIGLCYDRAGDEIPFDLFSEITGNTASSSSFTRKLATCRNFGLVTVTLSKITLTEIAERIFRPRDPHERQAALKDAFLSIDLFRRMYDKYLGKILPQDEYLANTFADYVPQDQAPKWVDRFVDSAQEAGLLLNRADGKTQVIDGARQAGIDNAVSAVAEALENQPDGQWPIGPQNVFTAGTTFAPIPSPPMQSHLQMLIDVLNAVDMTDAEQEAVWTLIRYVKRKEANAIAESSSGLP